MKFVAVMVLALLASFELGLRRADAGISLTIVYVDASATGAHNGKSWADAYTNLRSAINDAPPFSEVWVAAGVYHPRSLITTRSTSFVLKNGVAVYGGFRGDETSRAQRNVPANETVLSGDIGLQTESDNSYHVVMASGTNGSARLDGFTIRGGAANGTFDRMNGGGIFIKGGSPTLANLVIEGNLAGTDESRGGGVYVQDGSPTLTGVTIEENFATAQGGGMYAWIGAPKLTNVVFRDNGANGGGGGLYNAADSMSIDVAVFTGNSTEFVGGAIASTGALTVQNALFTGNRSNRAGAISSDQAELDVSNSTFSGNTAFNFGAAIASEATSDDGKLTISSSTFTENSGATAAVMNVSSSASLPALIQNSVFWDNQGAEIVNQGTGAVMTVVDSLVEGGRPANTSCNVGDVLTRDPQLGPLANNGGFSATHALAPGSPAIDAADDSTCPGADQRGVARPVDGDKNGTARCDLGAFEAVPAPPTVSFAAKGSAATESTPTAQIGVKLSTSSIKPVTVKYRVIGGTALGKGTDYTLVAGTVTFPPLATTRSITVALVNDRLDEPVETLIVQVYGASGATLVDPAIHIFRVKDDDPRALCRGRAATIVGTAGADNLAGTKRADVIVALGGNDTIAGNGGDDLICGGGGNDRVNGGNGNDVLVGQGGNDRLAGDAGADQAFGGGGADRLGGGAGSLDACDGGPGVDALLAAHGCEATSAVP